MARKPVAEVGKQETDGTEAVREEKQVAGEIAPERPGAFPIVGIGSSAGGLAALTAFFDAMPDKPGMAFVVIQHMDNVEKSMLPSILKRHTSMEVSTARDRVELKPDHVYVIPPGKNMQMVRRRLRLFAKPEPPYLAHSIDFFFRSMAQYLKDRAIGIVFSGLGMDGAFGAKLINHNLGMVMAQDPATADYRGMPESVIQLGVADYVLPPKDMPKYLMEYINTYYGKPAREREKELAMEKAELKKVFSLVKETRGHDLSMYKLSTVYRRVAKRMSVKRCKTIEGYASYLEENPEEIDVLMKEFMIRVTTFFKDPQAFAELKRFTKQLLKGRQEGTTVRAWILGCGTGEDTYSVAIMLQECIEELKMDLNFRLFATDIDKSSLNIARTGLYPASILSKDITEERLNKYFIDRGSHMQVKKEIRDRVLFSVREFTEAPVFTRLDLVTSRTVMVYLSPQSQRNLIPIFHSSLVPRGLLFPGTKNSIGMYAGMFRVLDEKWNIYERQG